MEKMLITDDNILYLKKEVLAFYNFLSYLDKNEFKIPLRGMGSVLHEYIKSLLFELARKKGLNPFPEYQPDQNNKYRVDIIWISKSGVMEAAFEIDKTIYPKSIKKLLKLNENCEKYIISIGLGKKPLPLNLLQGTGILLINLTQKNIGVYGDFR